MTAEDKKQWLIEFLSTRDLTFTIYHIPGIKIGCDSNIEREDNRPKQQGFEEWEVLHQTKDIFEASILEKKEQRDRGYKLDQYPYWLSYSNFAINGGWPKDIWKGRKRTDSNKIRNSLARLGTNHTIESKIKISISAKKDKTRSPRITAINLLKLSCPHCNKKMNIANLKRWHLDNCKQKQ